MEILSLDSFNWCEKLNLKNDIIELINKTIMVEAETFAFQAEEISIREWISNASDALDKISCREWISNASDALDKIRSRSLTEPSVFECQSEMVIKFISDKDSNTLTLIDAGIGMTRVVSINHLGTIVRSGTKAPIPKSQRNSRWRPKMAV